MYTCSGGRAGGDAPANPLRLSPFPRRKAPVIMYATDNPEPRLSRMSWQQVQPAARLLYNLFPPTGGSPFTWREWTDPEEGADPMPFGDEVAELFATVGYVLDLVEHAPLITDIVIHVSLLDPAGDYLRAYALDQGRF